MYCMRVTECDLEFLAAECCGVDETGGVVAMNLLTIGVNVHLETK